MAPTMIEIVTEGVTARVIFMVRAFDVAGLPLTPARLDVMIHVITSPFNKVLLVNVELLLPAFTPFTCH